MSNKTKDFSELGSFVFSTNSEFTLKREEENKEADLHPSEQQLQALLDKKNRGGKIVTIIRGFRGSDSRLKELSKKLKTLCGVGGSIKNGDILIQGNFRDKIIESLYKEGYKVKRVGS